MNGDGVVDDAWILIPKRGRGHGLFVFLGQKAGRWRLVQLDYSGGSPPQSMYISSTGPGSYKTACGKGYWACAPGEPAVLRLKRVGLVYAMYESASSIIYWDIGKNEFVRVWISD